MNQLKYSMKEIPKHEQELLNEMPRLFIEDGITFEWFEFGDNWKCSRGQNGFYIYIYKENFQLYFYDNKSEIGIEYSERFSDDVPEILQELWPLFMRVIEKWNQSWEELKEKNKKQLNKKRARDVKAKKAIIDKVLFKDFKDREINKWITSPNIEEREYAKYRNNRNNNEKP